MGINIQQYRASIGLFKVFGNLFQNVKKKTFSKFSVQKPTNMYLVMLLITLVASFISCSSQDPNPTRTEQDPSTKYVKIHHWKTLLRVRSKLLLKQEFLVPYNFRVISNFQSRYVNGNKSSKGIKIAHWNQGNSHLVNKMSEIKNIIAKHHPHVLGVSEANLLSGHDQRMVAIPNYTLHVCPTITNPTIGNSRVVVYTHCSQLKNRPNV